MPKIKVQRGVKMPPYQPVGTKGSGRRSFYPWLEMKIGDSFLFPEKVGRASHATAIVASNRHGRTFKVRKTPEGYRCWRIA